MTAIAETTRVRIRPLGGALGAEATGGDLNDLSAADEATIRQGLLDHAVLRLRGYRMDDVEFTRRLLDDVAGACSIDSKRVFATGMSNGGIMAYRLASELSERIAAIAPVGGPMGTKGCRPGRPVSVIHFHGTDDAFAPFQGGRGRGLSGTSFFSVDHSIAAWVEADGCDPNPVTIRLPDTTDDGTTVTRTTYGQGKDGAEVVLIVIEGGGHTWPGREPRLASLGKSTRDISANDLMWDFFQRHPLP